MKIVQVGTNRGFDDLTNHLLANYESLEFGLFVEPNQLHFQSIKKCYEKYSNVYVESIAIKPPLVDQETLKIYYHTNDYPEYQLASCNIEHIKNHLWCPHLWRDGEGEIKYFEIPCITLEQLFDQYQIKELDWLCLDIEGIDAEVLLTFDWQKFKIKRIEFEHLHLGYYKNAIYNMMIGMGYTQVNSLHEYDWAFENKNIVFAKEKLKNFPSVNFISIEESQKRRDVLHNNFEKYEIDNVTPHIFKKYKDEDFKFVGKDCNILTDIGRAPVTSHLKAIKHWYENTEEEYTFFCEDDLSFETVEYWNFTWEEFFNKIPSDWQCVQLALVREINLFEYFNSDKSDLCLRRRFWCDWSCCAYLITRSHAKKLLDNYYDGNVFCLEYKGIDREFRPEWAYRPTVETLIYSMFDENGPLVFPLFVESTSFTSSLYPNNDFSYHKSSHDGIVEWWKTQGKNLYVDDLFPYEQLN